MDFLLRRRDCKMVILSVCAQSASMATSHSRWSCDRTEPSLCLFPVLEGGAKGSLPVVATVFDKLNQVYKGYLEAEQSYAAATGAGPGRGGTAPKCPVRTQAVIDQSDMYTHVLSSFTERKVDSHALRHLNMSRGGAHGLFCPSGHVSQVHHCRADGVHPLPEPVPDPRAGKTQQGRPSPCLSVSPVLAYCSITCTSW